MAINLTTSLSNISVNTTSNVVTVSSTPVNVQLSATSVVSNASVREALSVSNISGYGNITYDNSNTSNGVFQYVGVSNADITTVITDNPANVRTAISNTSPITYDSSTGVIGLEQSLSNITLTQYQETIVDNGGVSGNITANIANGTIHKYTLNGNITKIDLDNIQSGGSATLILTQDSLGTNVLDTTTYPLVWSQWDFVNDFTDLDVSANAFNIINVLWDGSKYYASLVVDSEISPESLTVTGNISAGNLSVSGIIDTGSLSSTGNITSSANIEGVTLKSTGALGLVVDGNATIGGNLDVTGNINSETVVDLLVEDRNITMSYGTTGTPTANNHIFIDRGSEANTYIIWSEADDKFGFSNDGTNVTFFAEDTDGLSEGSTNLYFTTARANSAIGAYTGGMENMTGNIVAGNANINNSVNIAENSGANGHLTIHANTSVTTKPNVEIFAPGHARMASQPTAFATRLSPNGLEVNRLYDNNVTSTSNNFTVDLTELDFYAGNITGTDPIQVRVEDASDFTLNPSTDLERGKLRINKQGAGELQTAFTDIVTHEDTQLFGFSFGQSVTLANGATISSGKTISGAGGIDIGGAITTSGLTVDGTGNISASNVVVGQLVQGSNIYSTANITASDTVHTQRVNATGNIDGANINANYFHGDGSNLTGIAGDIESVTAGNGLVGGGTSGDVTLDVAGGFGITVNADNIELNNADLANVTTNVTTTGNIQGDYIIADSFFEGDLNGAVTIDVYNSTGGTLTKGQAVYLTGAETGDNPHVALADSDDSSKMPAIGLVRENIADTAVGQVVTSGEMNYASHGFTLGGDLYIDTTPGGLTTTVPTTEAKAIQKIGKVVGTNHVLVQGAFRTNQTPNLDEGNIFVGSSSNTAITVTPHTNFVTTGNVFKLSNSLTDINKVTSESATVFTAYGQNGIDFNQTVDSTESEIVGISTTGYSITEPTLPADFTVGTNTPGVLIYLNTTAGNTTATASIIAAGVIHALRGPTYATYMTGTSLANVMTGIGVNYFAGTNGINNPAAGLYGSDKGWTTFAVSTGSTTEIFPGNAYVTGITGNTLEFSEAALTTETARSVILLPNMVQSSGSNVMLKYNAAPQVSSNASFINLYGRFSDFDKPETLSNTTFDAISYGNTSSVTMTSIGTKNISEFAGSDESATRFRRNLLIGPSATPDPASGRSTTNNPSTLGVILENDGETFTGNNSPAPRFLINSYSGNFDNLTEYPIGYTVGQTGNLSLDIPQIKAPQLNLKAFRGEKSNTDVSTFKLLAGDVVGKIAWNVGQTDGTAFQGIDYINQPAAITVDVGDANVGYVANTYMHLTTTPDPGTNLGYYRNNANTINGANQQTNFTTKDGNVTIAAQTNGMITLAPTPDYGDSGNATVWTRYPGSTHEYHTFLNASFGNISAKTGTLVEIQPKSGTTTGSGGLGYDSIGNATLRLTTHESNSVVKGFWDLEFDQSAQSLHLKKDGTEEVKFTADQTVFTNIPVMPSYSNASLPSSVAGGIIYITNGNNKPAYGDGTNWYYYDGTQVT